MKVQPEIKSKVALCIAMIGQLNKLKENKIRLEAELQDCDEALDVLHSAFDELGYEANWVATTILQEKEYMKKERARRMEERLAREQGLAFDERVAADELLRTKWSSVKTEDFPTVEDEILNLQKLAHKILTDRQVAWSHKDYPINHMCKKEDE